MRMAINIFKTVVAVSCLAIAACGGDSSADTQSSSGSKVVSASVMKATVPGSASLSGSTIPSATRIIDSGNNAWTVSGGVIFENGALAGYSNGVSLLLYDNGTIYQEVVARGWWSWNGNTWVSSSDPRQVTSANGTSIPAATQITDGSGGVWTVSGGVIYENGVLAGFSRSVTQLLYENKVIYQENAAGGWWSWSNGAWVASSSPSNATSANGTNIPAATHIVDSSGNVWTVSAGVVYKNGAAAGYSRNVTELLYDNNSIYQQATAGGWWSWNGSGWVSSNDPVSVPTQLGISGSPRTSDLAGEAYNFVPGTTSPGGTLTFSASNMPAWASFSSATGAITGTPSAAQAGNYSNIVISVNDGSATASLAAFSINVTVPPSSTGAADLSWTAPTQNTNGTPLTDLAGYTIYYGTDPSALTHTVQVSSPSASNYLVSNLSAGTYYFAVAAYTLDGMHSTQSPVGSKTIL